MSGDVLYEDAVYYGNYSCGLRTLKQKRADLHRRSEAPPPPSMKATMRASAAGAAIENMEAEHHAKNKKGPGQARPTQGVISLKSMQAVLLQEERGVLHESYNRHIHGSKGHQTQAPESEK